MRKGFDSIEMAGRQIGYGQHIFRLRRDENLLIDFSQVLRPRAEPARSVIVSPPRR